MFLEKENFVIILLNFILIFEFKIYLFGLLFFHNKILLSKEMKKKY